MSPPRVPYYGPPDVAGAQDQDNFVRNLITLYAPWWGTTPAPTWSAHKPSKSVSGLPPILDLDEIKRHCHIDLDQTYEDPTLLGLEMAARLTTQRFLRADVDLDDTVGENIKQAMYLLVAHWYRNREAVVAGSMAEIPLGYLAILFPERDYKGAY
jgi:uncharacterized phage protein (predicted DNA packaging)